MDAAPARVYATIADYREGHPRILPKQFSGLTVERGGVGAGTVIRFQMRAFGTTRNFRGEVTEPEPGRVLVETYQEPNPSATTFTVNPAGSGCEVVISTVIPVRNGLLGSIERALIERYLIPIYREELGLLARVAGDGSA